MAKTIKFNLNIDGKSVRNLSDLTANFCVEDLLELYNSKMLQRWLEVRDYNSELKAVCEITSTDPMVIIKDLIRIFGIEVDSQEVEKSVYILQYNKEHASKVAELKNSLSQVKCVVDNYQQNYERLVNEILDNADNIPLVKANIAALTSDYAWAFSLDHRSLFYKFFNKSPVIILCLLMNDLARSLYLPMPLKDEQGNVISNELGVVFDTTYATEYSNVSKHDKRLMWQEINKFIHGNSDLFMSIVNEHCKVFRGATDGYWKDLELKGNRYLILSMTSGCFVRAAAQKDGDLSQDKITDCYVILDGIDFKGNDVFSELVYMEI